MEECFSLADLSLCLPDLHTGTRCSKRNISLSVHERNEAGIPKGCDEQPCPFGCFPCCVIDFCGYRQGDWKAGSHELKAAGLVLYINPGIFRMAFNKLPARGHLIAHQHAEYPVCLGSAFY